MCMFASQSIPAICSSSYVFLKRMGIMPIPVFGDDNVRERGKECVCVKISSHNLSGDMVDFLIALMLCLIFLFSPRIPPPEPPSYQQEVWCTECQEGGRDIGSVSQEELTATSIWLHALKYSNTHPFYEWTFTSPTPPWATSF